MGFFAKHIGAKVFSAERINANGFSKKDHWPQKF